jgi:hypothetical protein
LQEPKKKEKENAITGGQRCEHTPTIGRKEDRKKHM